MRCCLRAPGWSVRPSKLTDELCKHDVMMIWCLCVRIIGSIPHGRIQYSIVGQRRSSCMPYGGWFSVLIRWVWQICIRTVHPHAHMLIYSMTSTLHFNGIIVNKGSVKVLHEQPSKTTTQYMYCGTHTTLSLPASVSLAERSQVHNEC